MTIRAISFVFMAWLLAGCSSPKEQQPSPAAPAKTIKAAVVTDAGGIEDKSFNASAWAGLQRAQKELGIEPKFLESREQSDYKDNLEALAEQGNDLVFAVGYLMEDALKEVAPNHPNVKFAIIDGSAPDLPNCASIKFREEEGAFLAGFLAGKMTKTGALGFVGGLEGPILKKFEVGYIAGARTARPDVRVIIKYVGDFVNSEKGKVLAKTEIQQGADIIFAAAGRAGLGALDAVQEKGEGCYGIGVDADQDDLHPGRILTSMMKGVGTGVFEAVKMLKENRWKAGEKVLGVQEGGVHLSPMKHTKKDIPADVLKQLTEVEGQVASGKIKPPATDDDLQTFVPPKIAP